MSVVVGEPVAVDSREDAGDATERLREALAAGVERAIALFPAPLTPGAAWVPADLGGSAPTVEEAEQGRRERSEQRRRARGLRRPPADPRG